MKNELCWYCDQPAIVGIEGDSVFALCKKHAEEKDAMLLKRQEQQEARDRERRMAECIASCCREAHDG